MEALKVETVRFGVQVLQAMPDYSTLKKVVLECERLDFDSVWVYDHLQFTYGPTFESWTILSALAEATRKIRIGTLVTCNVFRYPSLLAKMAATVDVISGGRLNFGIGAGWHDAEAAAYGIPFPRAGVRVEMLDEALLIMKKLWTEDKATFKGKHYSINEAVSIPKPVQRPYPPILIGGGGDKMLRVIARHGNAWNCGYESIEDYKKEIERLETACREVGRDRMEIENTFQSRVIIAETEEDALIRTSQSCEERNGKPEDPDWKFAIKGSPENCIKMVKDYVDAGITHFTLLFADVASLKPLQLFAREVMPEFH